MTDQTPPSQYEGGDPFGDSGETAEAGRGREWLGQLQSMIDNIATQAGPIARDVAAKAAELAALAGEKAGPIAHKAAEVTEAAGTKLAERGRVVAADLRRDAAEKREHMGDVAPAGMEPGPGSQSAPFNDQPGRIPDSADTTGE